MKVGIEPRFLDWKAIKVKPLPEGRILANHRIGRRILDINSTLPAHFVIADGIVAMEGNGRFVERREI